MEVSVEPGPGLQIVPDRRAGTAGAELAAARSSATGRRSASRSPWASSWSGGRHGRRCGRGRPGIDGGLDGPAWATSPSPAARRGPPTPAAHGAARGEDGVKERAQEPSRCRPDAVSETEASARGVGQRIMVRARRGQYKCHPAVCPARPRPGICRTGARRSASGLDRASARPQVTRNVLLALPESSPSVQLTVAVEVPGFVLVPTFHVQVTLPVERPCARASGRPPPTPSRRRR